jgi:hypothetical protein
VVVEAVVLVAAEVGECEECPTDEAEPVVDEVEPAVLATAVVLLSGVALVPVRRGDCPLRFAVAAEELELPDFELSAR